MFIADRTGLHAQRFGLLAERAFDVHFCERNEVNGEIAEEKKIKLVLIQKIQVYKMSSHEVLF